MSGSQSVVSRWSLRQSALILLAYGALAVMMAWPIAGRLGTAFPASDGDAWVHLWTFDWVKDALFSGQSPYFTDRLFYPDGTSLLFHNIAWLHIAAWIPLQALVGAEAAYSLIFLAVFALNGFGTYLLAREITSSTPAGFIAGLIVAFWPYTLSHHNHPNLILIAWIPLALLYLKRFFDQQQLRDVLLATLFIVLIGFTRWQLLVIGGILIGLYIIYRLFGDKAARTRRVMVILAGSGLLAMLIMAPILAPVIRQQLTREDPDELFVDEDLGQSDLLAYLVPSRYHPLWGEAAFRLTEGFGVNRVFVPFLGFTALLLAIYGTVAGWPRSAFWLAAALLYIVLALGPDLHINGRVMSLPMPYRLVEDLFLFKIIRHPDRLNVVLSIPVAILASLGVASLLQKVQDRRWALALIALVAALILLEYIVAYPTFPAGIPAWYEELAQEPGEFGVLGIPMAPRASPDKAYMYYQIRHGKALVEGHVSRPPDDAFHFIESVPLLHNLRPVDVSTPDPAITNIAEQLRQLAEANIRYLILHKEFLAAEEVNAWKAWLVQEPLHEDEDLVVYRTDPQLGRDFYRAYDLMPNPGHRSGVGLVQAAVSPTQSAQGGTVQVPAVWTSDSEIDQNHAFCLNLVDEGQQVVQSHCQPLAPEWPTSNWRANEIVAGNYELELSPYLAGGSYTVTIQLIDPRGDPIGESATIGSLTMTTQSRSFSSPEPSNQVDVDWDGKLGLLGYDVAYPDNESVAITLYWQAQDRMDVSYTNFLHVIDPASGQIVSQADVIPRGWSYPTNWWETGEIVQDTVLLSLTGVPPGDYVLTIGWYELETGERLPVAGRDRQNVTDNALSLTTIRREGQE